LPVSFADSDLPVAFPNSDLRVDLRVTSANIDLHVTKLQPGLSSSKPKYHYDCADAISKTKLKLSDVKSPNKLSLSNTEFDILK